MPLPQRFQFASLAEAEPHNGDTPSQVFIASFAAFVSVGTCVIVDIGAHEPHADDNDSDTLDTSSLLVARLVDVVHSKDGIAAEEIAHLGQQQTSRLLKVNILTRFDRELYREFNKTPSTHPTCRHVTEVFQTMEYIWIVPEMLKDIAFVFRAPVICDSIAPVQGMVRGFVIRYSYNNNSKSMDPISAEWRPFSCNSFDNHNNNAGAGENAALIPPPESFSRRVWIGILAVRERLRRALNTRSNRPRVYMQVYICLEVWNFIVCSLTDFDEIVVNDGERRYTEKLVTEFLKRRK